MVNQELLKVVGNKFAKLVYLFYICIMKVIIYEYDNWFAIHTESGQLLNSGFATEGEAVLFCKKNNLHIVDVFFEVVV